MTVAEKVKSFFQSVEDIWAAIPGYVKVFFYSVISSTVGLWVLGEFSLQAVVLIVLTNLGLYSGPKAIGKMMK